MALRNEISEQIKDKTGLSVVDFAKKHKVSRQIFYECLKGRGTRRVRVVIALIIERSPSELFTYESEYACVLDCHEYTKELGNKK